MKVEAGARLWGPGMEPVGAGGQTGVAVGAGQLGCGQPEGKEGVERTEGDVCVERGVKASCGRAVVREWEGGAAELKDVLCL